MCIKEVAEGSQEITILHHFSTGALLYHPSNHVLPLLDIFQPSTHTAIGTCFMVTPRLVPCSDFSSLGEFIDFVEQILQVRAMLTFVSAA